MGKGMNVIIAAAAGFIGGVLLAPKSGADTRKELMEKANDTKRDAARKAEEAKQAMHKGVDRMRSSAKDTSGELSDFAQSAKTSASRMAEEAKSLGDEAKVRAGRVKESTHDAADETVRDTTNTINAAPAPKRSK